LTNPAIAPMQPAHGQTARNDTGRHAKKNERK
jgi:hypothetical protein